MGMLLCASLVKGRRRRRRRRSDTWTGKWIAIGYWWQQERLIADLGIGSERTGMRRMGNG